MDHNRYPNDENNFFFMEVEKVTKQLDQKSNNPVKNVKWKVYDSKKNRIAEVKEMLLKLDARKNYGSQPVKQNKKVVEDNTLNCDSCHYQTVVKTKLKRHMFFVPYTPTTTSSNCHEESDFQNQHSGSKSHRKVDMLSEWLKCMSSIRGEEKLESHDKTVHKTENVEIVTTKEDTTRLLNELWAENSNLIKEKAEQNIYLEQLKIREQEMIQNMTTMKADITYLIKEKEKTEESYQAASKCVADQQGIITTQS